MRIVLENKQIALNTLEGFVLTASYIPAAKFGAAAIPHFMIAAAASHSLNPSNYKNRETIFRDEIFSRFFDLQIVGFVRFFEPRKRFSTFKGTFHDWVISKNKPSLEFCCILLFKKKIKIVPLIQNVYLKRHVLHNLQGEPVK